MLKDHNHPDSIRIASLGYTCSVRSRAQDQGYEMGAISLKGGNDYSSKPCNFWITSSIEPSWARDIIAAMEKIKHLIDPKLIDYSKSGKNVDLLVLKFLNMFLSKFKTFLTTTVNFIKD